MAIMSGFSRAEIDLIAPAAIEVSIWCRISYSFPVLSAPGSQLNPHNITFTAAMSLPSCQMARKLLMPGLEVAPLNLHFIIRCADGLMLASNRGRDDAAYRRTWSRDSHSL